MSSDRQQLDRAKAITARYCLALRNREHGDVAAHTAMQDFVQLFAFDWRKTSIEELQAVASGNPTSPEKVLNLDHDEARALHRIVRAMHDGECPKCHAVYSSDQMRFRELVTYGFQGPATTGWRCPNCLFEITDKEATEVFRIFAPFMERNLAIFEKWRAERKTEIVKQRAPFPDSDANHHWIVLENADCLAVVWSCPHGPSGRSFRCYQYWSALTPENRAECRAAAESVAVAANHNGLQLESSCFSWFEYEGTVSQ